jgi:transposase, IS30 family
MKKREEFRHLTAQDRDRIHALYGHGHNQSDVARVLGVNKGTVSRELSRYGKRTWRYSSVQAQHDADEKRSRSKRPGMKIEATPELRRFIIRELKALRSPDEIAGRMKRDEMTPRVGTAAIYTWLYSPYGKPYCRYLCTRRVRKRRQKRVPNRVLIPDRISFRDRPESPDLIHAEGDLFVSPQKSGSTACGLLLVEEESKLLSGEIIANKRAASITPAMRRAVQSVGADTCTLDNGIENVHHRSFGVDTYFCDRGTPTQKPNVEGSIGLVRRWFIPKGTNLDTVPNDTYRSQLHLLNHKYRKSLGYRSAYEVALERGIITRVPRISLLKAVAFR